MKSSNFQLLSRELSYSEMTNKERPSTIIIRIFLGILILFGIFAVGAMLNYAFKQAGENPSKLPEIEEESLP